MCHPRKYMAASVPRFLRVARLSYLPLQSVIGCWYIERRNDVHYIFDIIMLPADQFMRAKSYLGVPDAAAPTLSRSIATSYVLKDTKEIIVPDNEVKPEIYARDYFLTLFKQGAVQDGPTDSSD
jgi:hypothetical protein